MAQVHSHFLKQHPISFQQACEMLDGQHEITHHVLVKSDFASLNGLPRAQYYADEYCIEAELVVHLGLMIKHSAPYNPS